MSMSELNVMSTVKPVSASTATVIPIWPRTPVNIRIITATLTTSEKMILNSATALVFFAILIES